MKVSDILFLAGIVITVIGAGTGLFPIMGVGALVFVSGVVARSIERAGGQARSAARNDGEDEPQA